MRDYASLLWIFVNPDHARHSYLYRVSKFLLAFLFRRL